MADFLEANGFDVFEIKPRFLPLTVKLRFPISPWFIRTYLASPIKPWAGEMLIRTRVARSRPKKFGPL
jgi:hypothetical protein